jgi:hypothetical protein
MYTPRVGPDVTSLNKPSSGFSFARLDAAEPELDTGLRFFTIVFAGFLLVTRVFGDTAREPVLLFFFLQVAFFTLFFALISHLR